MDPMGRRNARISVLFWRLTLVALVLFLTFFILVDLTGDVPRLFQTNTNVATSGETTEFAKRLQMFDAECKLPDGRYLRDGEVSCLYIHNALVESTTSNVFFYLPDNLHLQNYNRISKGTEWSFPLKGPNVFNLQMLYLFPISVEEEWKKLLASTKYEKPLLSPGLLKDCENAMDPNCRTVHRPLAVVEVLMLHASFPVIWSNLWHTFADFFVSLFFTLKSLLPYFVNDPGEETIIAENPQVMPFGLFANEIKVPYYPSFNFLSYVAKKMGVTCETMRMCTARSLFDPFNKLFRGRFFFSEPEYVNLTFNNGTVIRKHILSERKILRVPYKATSTDKTSKNLPVVSFQWLYVRTLLLGINGACSVTFDDVDSPQCRENLWNVRNTVLKMYNMNPNRTVLDVADKGSRRNATCLGRLVKKVDKPKTSVENKDLAIDWERKKNEEFCPSVYLLQRNKFSRHFWNFDESVQAIHQMWEEYPLCCRPGNLSTFVFNPSFRKPFEEQLRAMNSHSIFFAGRGAATAIYMFLPLGAVVIPVTGGDGWQAYKNLEPPWIRVNHLTVQVTRMGNSSAVIHGYVDGNIISYLLDPPVVASFVRDSALLILRGKTNKTVVLQ